MILTIYSSLNTTHLSETEEIFGIAIVLFVLFVTMGFTLFSGVLLCLLYREKTGESFTIYIDMI